MLKTKRVLFVDFNGVISYNSFWKSLSNPEHSLHRFYNQIQDLLFSGENRIEGLINDWMVGIYTSEDIHRIISEKLSVPYKDMFESFIEDCKNLDISKPVLNEVKKLKKSYYCILRTDNMDTLHRFTIPAHPYLAEAFDEVHSSYLIRQLKRTNNGEYFTNTISNLGANIKNCILVDDGKVNIELFEKLGGKGYRTQTEKEAVEVLRDLNVKD